MNLGSKYVGVILIVLMYKICIFISWCVNKVTLRNARCDEMERIKLLNKYRSVRRSIFWAHEKGPSVSVFRKIKAYLKHLSHSYPKLPTIYVIRIYCLSA